MKNGKAASRAAALIVLGAGLGAPVVHAQEGALGQPTLEQTVSRHDTYGTTSTSNYVIQAYEFLPAFGGMGNFVSNGFGARGCSSNCSFIAPVMLPAGAVILALEFEACDTDPAGQTSVNLVRQPSLEGPFTVLEAVGTGVPATPGCAFFTATLATPHTVNNNNNTYQVKGDVSSASGLAVRFQAVRIVYRLRVSNAPGTATFPNDVPTSHPFFQFVEALAAAGITGGCSAGSYCPNSPVTRGEMAVFLATALGLHFPN
jgi:hypothetical protein